MNYYTKVQVLFPEHKQLDFPKQNSTKGETDRKMADTHKHLTRKGHVCQRQHRKHRLKGVQVNKEKGETHQGNGGRKNQKTV